MFAFSKVDLLEKFQNWLNSFLEDEPEPSEILFDIDIPEALSCSANLYNLCCSSMSAISNKLSAISIACFQICKS